MSKPFVYTETTPRLIAGYVQRRYSDVEIATRLGCSVDTLRKIARKHGISLKSDERRKVEVQVAIAPNARAALEREASLRGTTAADLSTRCLEMIATNGLFAAILDL